MLGHIWTLATSFCFSPETDADQRILCEEDFFAIRSECERQVTWNPFDAAPTVEECLPLEFEFQGHLEVTYPEVHGSGFYADVFRTSLSDVLIKVTHDPIVSICNEQAALKVLDGYQGIVPRTFSITPYLPASCKSQMFAMEHIGDADWAEVVKVEDRAFYLRMARLLEVIRSLHEFGFVHKDLSERNIRVGLQSEDQIYLVDLAAACAWSQKGTCSRKRDMITIADLVMDVRGSHHWRKEYKLDMFHMDPHRRPNYEYWIEYFRQRAEQF